MHACKWQAPSLNIEQDGFPDSRISGAALAPEASKVGARIIAVDRPGYGWSSPQRDRTLLGHAQDVEAIADHLKLMAVI